MAERKIPPTNIPECIKSDPVALQGYLIGLALGRAALRPKISQVRAELRQAPVVNLSEYRSGVRHG